MTQSTAVATTPGRVIESPSRVRGQTPGGHIGVPLDMLATKML